MSPTFISLGIDQLSVAERILLVEEIWDSIAASPGEPSLTESQRQDLEHRLAEYRDDPHSGASWEDVKARLRRNP